MSGYYGAKDPHAGYVEDAHCCPMCDSIEPGPALKKGDKCDDCGKTYWGACDCCGDAVESKGFMICDNCACIPSKCDRCGAQA